VALFVIHSTTSLRVPRLHKRGILTDEGIEQQAKQDFQASTKEEIQQTKQCFAFVDRIFGKQDWFAVWKSELKYKNGEISEYPRSRAHFKQCIKSHIGYVDAEGKILLDKFTQAYKEYANKNETLTAEEKQKVTEDMDNLRDRCLKSAPATVTLVGEKPKTTESADPHEKVIDEEMLLKNTQQKFCILQGTETYFTEDKAYHQDDEVAVSMLVEKMELAKEEE